MVKNLQAYNNFSIEIFIYLNDYYIRIACAIIIIIIMVKLKIKIKYISWLCKIWHSKFFELTLFSDKLIKINNFKLHCNNTMCIETINLNKWKKNQNK